MWRMLQQPAAEDYVLGTGTANSVRRFVELTAENLGLAIEWKGAGAAEHGLDRKSGRTVVRIDPGLHRPAEVDVLFGNPAKASRKLGWKPSTSLPQLVTMMAEADDRRVRENRLLY